MHCKYFNSRLLFAYHHMTETLCRSCGSEELHVKTVCGFCNQPINFACGHCGHIADEKVHVDCRNAEFFLSSTTS
jgi:predicted amidophosphoribosyltransferase